MEACVQLGRVVSSNGVIEVHAELEVRVAAAQQFGHLVGTQCSQRDRRIDELRHLVVHAKQALFDVRGAHKQPMGVIEHERISQTVNEVRGGRGVVRTQTLKVVHMNEDAAGARPGKVFQRCLEFVEQREFAGLRGDARSLPLNANHSCGHAGAQMVLAHDNAIQARPEVAFAVPKPCRHALTHVRHGARLQTLGGAYLEDDLEYFGEELRCGHRTLNPHRIGVCQHASRLQLGLEGAHEAGFPNARRPLNHGS